MTTRASRPPFARGLTRALVLALALATACGGGRQAGRAEPEAAPPVPVSIETVTPRLHDVLYRASGTVGSRARAVLSARVVGQVSAVKVRAGDPVRKGQVMVELDAAELHAQSAAARAGAEEASAGNTEAESAVAAATAHARLAEATHARYRQLADKGAASPQELDEALARRDAAAAALAAAEARLELARSAARRAGAAAEGAAITASYSRLVAPFDGVVAERRIDPGNLVAPGTPLLVVEETGPYRVDAFVEESRGPVLAVGDPAWVAIGPTTRLAATVVEIEPGVDPGTRTFRVRVELDDPAPDAALRPGRFASVELVVGQSERLTVPPLALVRNGSLDLVFVAEDDVARLRLVTRGEEHDRRVEILSGLDPGERVITAPVGSLQDGARVVAAP